MSRLIHLALLIISLLYSGNLLGCGRPAPRTIPLLTPPPVPLFTLSQSGRIAALAFSPDGRWLAAGSQAVPLSKGGLHTGVLQVWDLATHKVVASHRQRQWVQSVAFSPDGKFLAVGCSTSDMWRGKDKTFDPTVPKAVVVYSVPDFKERGRLHGKDIVRKVTFTPDNRGLLVLRLTQVGVQLCRHDLATLRKQWEFEAQESFAWGLSLHPNGKTVAVGLQSSRRSSFPDPLPGRFLDTETGKELGRHGVYGQVQDFLRYTPSGQQLLFRRYKFSPLLWDIATVQTATLAAFERQTWGKNHMLEFSRDGRWLVAVNWFAYHYIGPDGQARGEGQDGSEVLIWDYQAEKLVQNWKYPREEGTVVAISPDSKLLALASFRTEERDRHDIHLYQMPK